MAIDAMRSKEPYYMDRAISACQEALKDLSYNPEREFFTRGKELARLLDDYEKFANRDIDREVE